MKIERTKRWKAIALWWLRLLRLAAALLGAVIGVLYELLNHPVWERLLVLITLGVWYAAYLMSERLRRWEPRRQPENPDAAAKRREIE